MFSYDVGNAIKHILTFFKLSCLLETKSLFPKYPGFFDFPFEHIFLATYLSFACQPFGFFGSISGNATIVLCFLTSNKYFASRSFLPNLYVTVTLRSSPGTSKEPFQTLCESDVFCIKQRSLWSLVCQGFVFLIIIAATLKQGRFTYSYQAKLEKSGCNNFLLTNWEDK